jgi:hypothetical protein
VPARRLYFPPADLRHGLADARRRGLAFDEAWVEAWAGVRWPNWTGGIAEWREALNATKPEWRRAYEREPSSGGAALSLLAEAAGGHDERADVALVA